jgi:hypothetical protein
MKILRNLPALKGRPTIDLVVNRLLPRLPDSLYDLLSRHAWDPSVYTALQAVEGCSSPGGDGIGVAVGELMASIEIF